MPTNDRCWPVRAGPLFAMGAVLLALSACAMPQTDIQQGGADGYLTIKGAPASAQITIDSAAVGSVGSFDPKKNPLRIHGGAHKVRVTVGYSVLIDRTI